MVRSLRSKSFKNRFKNLSLPLLGGMRYAQKFFRINFKFYKFLLGSLRSKSFKNRFENLSFPCSLGSVAPLKIFQKSF